MQATIYLWWVLQVDIYYISDTRISVLRCMILILIQNFNMLYHLDSWSICNLVHKNALVFFPNHFEVCHKFLGPPESHGSPVMVKNPKKCPIIDLYSSKEGVWCTKCNPKPAERHKNLTLLGDGLAKQWEPKQWKFQLEFLLVPLTSDSPAVQASVVSLLWSQC